MNLATRYATSNLPTVSKARQIPGLAVNFVDQLNIFQNEWQNFQKVGSPTTFTPKSLAYYNTELKNMVILGDFVRLEQDIPLNQWNPTNGYFTPGQSGTLGQ